jgi:hypothetical protein
MVASSAGGNSSKIPVDNACKASGVGSQRSSCTKAVMRLKIRKFPVVRCKFEGKREGREGGNEKEKN